MDGNGQVLEGFICPICMNDCKTPQQLTKHFEEFHDDNPEILKSLKELFGKAKKKILKQDEIPEFMANNSVKNKFSPESNWPYQEIGITKSHTDYFKEIRKSRLERYFTETNKLIIRLDKLLCNLPSDPTDRKAHERAIVPWIDEKDVKLCPSCAKSFHVARRKHHCRLCGAVMCHDCTKFLSTIDAKKMTNRAMMQGDSQVSPVSAEPQFTDRIVRAGIGLTKLARSPSSGSLNSVLSLVNDPANGEQNFRLCGYCKDLLEARERLKAQQSDSNVVCQLHEKMRAYMTEASHYSEIYNKRWNSISVGETTYDLRDSQILRGKIAKVGESIDLISKKILLLSVNSDTGAVTNAIELKLHKTIREAAMKFITDRLTELPTLPSEQEYLALQDEREKRIQARIAYEKQLEAEEMQKEKRREQQQKSENPSEENSPQKTNPTILDQSQGWGPSSAAIMVNSTMDPIIEQMSNLKSYIKQAKAAQKYEEVETLERNLKELQSAYFAMNQDNSDG